MAFSALAASLTVRLLSFVRALRMQAGGRALKRDPASWQSRALAARPEVRQMISVRPGLAGIVVGAVVLEILVLVAYLSVAMG